MTFLFGLHLILEVNWTSKDVGTFFLVFTDIFNQSIKVLFPQHAQSLTIYNKYWQNNGKAHFQWKRVNRKSRPPHLKFLGTPLNFVRTFTTYARSVCTKCDFNPICCRMKSPFLDGRSWWKYLPHNSNPYDFAVYRLFYKAPYKSFVECRAK